MEDLWGFFIYNKNGAVGLGIVIIPASKFVLQVVFCSW